MNYYTSPCGSPDMLPITRGCKIPSMATACRIIRSTIYPA